MKCFVTVGSTQFDPLIVAMDSDQVLCALHARGYTSVELQIGSYSPRSGAYVPRSPHFRYQPSLDDCIAGADLVVSHGGSGSILQVLRARKPLIAVVNDTLMHNHQKEIVEAMAGAGHCIGCFDVTELPSIVTPMQIETAHFGRLKPLPPANSAALQQEIDSLFG